MQEEISFGTWLRKQRRALDLSQRTFAHQVGCAEVTLRRIEAGTLKPSKELTTILLEKLDIPEAEHPVWISFARGTSGFPLPPNSSHKLSTNLPVSLTSFIGREKEQGDVIHLISKHRLVTLTGTGGVGKTRLSIIVGEQVLENYPDGVWLVELAPILNPLLVTRTTAVAIGLQHEPQRPVIDMLADHLRAKQMLIILDNCEHLLEACAQLADSLLKRCPGLRFLTTSREVLGSLGEAVYLVPSLDIPDFQQSVDTFRDSESVHLFEERARLTRADFSLTIENASSVARICSQLDGIPLAIELAAVRVNMFSAEQIAARLQESFNLLTTGNRNALPRHQALRAAIDWSYDLLSGAEQALLRRLSIFVNGWTLEAAQSICADTQISSAAIVDLLAQLINKSLVVVEKKQIWTRYRMLETIRQYAREKLGKADEEEYSRVQHLHYYLKLSEQIEQELVRPQQSEWFALTNQESNNLRAALEQAGRTDVESGLYISGRLELFWTYFDSREGMRWLTEFLLKPESKVYPHARAKALYTQSRLLYNFEQFNEAQDASEESRALFRAVGDQYGEIDSLFLQGLLSSPAKIAELAIQALALAKSLGDIRRQAMSWDLLGWDHRDFKRAFTCWEEAVALYRQAGHWGGLARCLSALGFFLLMDGQLDAAQKYLDESKLLYQQLNLKSTDHLLASLGQIALVQGDYELARTYFQQAAEITKELGIRTHYLWATVRLGYAELLAGNMTEARQIFVEAVQNFQKDGNQTGVVFSLEGMSSLYVTVDKYNVAARLIGSADTTREEAGDTRPKLEQANVNKMIAACIAKMGEAAYIDAYEGGSKLTLDEAVDLALKTAKEME